MHWVDNSHTVNTGKTN